MPTIQGMTIQDVYQGMKDRNVADSTDRLTTAHVTQLLVLAV